MRLDEAERQAILGAIGTQDPQADVFLFGSRVDDARRGGDIDLLVLSQRIDLMAKLDILGDLHRRLGERRIDLLVFPDLFHSYSSKVAVEGIRL